MRWMNASKSLLFRSGKTNVKGTMVSASISFKKVAAETAVLGTCPDSLTGSDAALRLSICANRRVIKSLYVFIVFSSLCLEKRQTQKSVIRKNLFYKFFLV